jgi:hypothetical protein
MQNKILKINSMKKKSNIKRITIEELCLRVINANKFSNEFYALCQKFSVNNDFSFNITATDEVKLEKYKKSITKFERYGVE